VPKGDSSILANSWSAAFSQAGVMPAAGVAAALSLSRLTLF